eukprot:scaffold22245_cov63-Phaeocystis_antarctica.AAC.7
MCRISPPACRLWQSRPPASPSPSRPGFARIAVSKYAKVRGELDVKDLRAHGSRVDGRNRDLEGSKLQSKRRAHGFHCKLCSGVHLGEKRHLWSRCARRAPARACAGAPLQPSQPEGAAVSETLVSVACGLWRLFPPRGTPLCPMR